MLNKVREEKGITLVVLIITIIVLLCLAGVIVYLVFGQDGLTGKDNALEAERDKAYAKDIVTMALKVVEKEQEQAQMNVNGLVQTNTNPDVIDAVVKAMKGIELEPDNDIQIVLNVTSYIPDEYISDSSQKIEIYQNIALCKNEKDIENVVDEIIDRFGDMPSELENLLDIARIKYLSKPFYITKIASKNGKKSITLKHLS